MFKINFLFIISRKSFETYIAQKSSVRLVILIFNVFYSKWQWSGSKNFQKSSSNAQNTENSVQNTVSKANTVWSHFQWFSKYKYFRMGAPKKICTFKKWKKYQSIILEIVRTTQNF